MILDTRALNSAGPAVPVLIICLVILNALSLFALYSSLHQGGEFKQEDIFFRQLRWIIISWLFLILFAFINYRLYFDFSFIFYAACIVLLIAVYIFGSKVMGARRWLTILGVNFQPSELCKMATIFILARLFSRDRPRGIGHDLFLPLGLVGAFALLIFKQPDLGTALFIIFLFLAMGLASPVKKRYFISLILIGLCLAPLAWRALKPYQRKRLAVFINPNLDPLGAGYTIIQSKIAIGSGQVFGKGFLSGTQNQFNFLPERHTDFIFTVVAEEWGFAGSMFLLLIYWLILKKILNITKQTKDPFGRLLTVGIGWLFFLHIFINIGMTLGLLPVVGLPLIFLSYGGSNMLISFVLAGILINIART